MSSSKNDFLKIMNRAVVLIPLYKEGLSESEEFSLRNTQSVLADWDICIIAPLVLSSWLSSFRNDATNKTEVRIKFFSDKFFTSVDQYNRLLLSRSFYKVFSNYEYMLIVQTDALVFSDRLNYWCDRGYSYIGAPWFDGFNKPIEPRTFIGVGNGGFSLRRIDDFLRVLSRPRYLRKSSFDSECKSLSLIKNVKSIYRRLLIPYDSFHLSPHLNEDYFWGVVASRQFSFFNTPTPVEAAHFSFEVLPDFLYEIIDHTLPFGCHAWEKYDLAFWQQTVTRSYLSGQDNMATIAKYFGVHYTTASRALKELDKTGK